MSSFQVRACSDLLSRDGNTGIWRAQQSAAVSYPDDGNADCFRLEDTSFWFLHRNRCIVAAVEQFPPPGFILDVGGGNGFVANALIRAGWETVLLEPGDEGARNARIARCIPDVICATLQDAAFKSGSVPSIGLFDVLEHVEDDGGFLDELRRVLAPGGMAYVTVPAHQWLWSRIDIDSGHYRRYGRPELEECFSAAGFQVMYATYLFEALLPPLYLIRTLPFRLGLRRGARQAEAEHAGGGGLVAAAMQSLLSREPAAIANRRRIATGTTCLLVARKPTGTRGGAR